MATLDQREQAAIELLGLVRTAAQERLHDPKNVKKGTWDHLPVIGEHLDGEKSLLGLFEEEEFELEKAILTVHTHPKNRALIEAAIRECGDVIAVTGMILQKLHKILKGANK